MIVQITPSLERFFNRIPESDWDAVIKKAQKTHQENMPKRRKAKKRHWYKSVRKACEEYLSE